MTMIAELQVQHEAHCWMCGTAVRRKKVFRKKVANHKEYDTAMQHIFFTAYEWGQGLRPEHTRCTEVYDAKMQGEKKTEGSRQPSMASEPQTIESRGEMVDVSGATLVDGTSDQRHEHVPGSSHCDSNVTSVPPSRPCV